MDGVQFVGALDCGTTSTRFIVFDKNGRIIVKAQKEYEQIRPHPGWHEQSPEAMLESANICMKEASSKLQSLGYSAANVKTIGIANQRETAIMWRRDNGKPVFNAIVWDDIRTGDLVRTITASNPLGAHIFTEETGLPLTTYFSALKLAWLLRHVPSVKEQHDKDELMFGTVESWILYNLTGGAEHKGVHLTDITNACRTMLMNAHTKKWDVKLLDFFGLRPSILPAIVSNSEVYGNVFEGDFKGVSISGMIGDQQAALVGQKCLEQWSTKATFGTGCFMLFHTGQARIASSHGLITTVAYQAGRGPVCYALEGSVAVAGSAISWLRDNMELIKSANEVSELAAKVKDTGGVFFVTAFSGLFAPYWDPSASALMIGLTSYTNKCHIARATLESAGYQTRAMLEAMAEDVPFCESVKKLRVDGGMMSSDLVCQILADILGIEVERPNMREATSLGCALMAGSAIGLFGWDVNKPGSLSDVNKEMMQTFSPIVDPETRERRWRLYERAVQRSLRWDRESDEGERFDLEDNR